jgi:DNA-binding transcriptional ArsR family regulator
MTQPFVVTSSEQLEVIASPGREAIVDTVALIGPCSIPELARALRRSRHSLYYHARALRDAGLLVETRRSGEGTRTTAYYDVLGRPFSVSFDLSTEARRQAVLSLANARMRTALRGFERACRPGAVTADGPRRDLWATHLKGWLSLEDLEEANRLLARLIQLVGAFAADEVAGKRAYEFSFVLCPHEPQGGLGQGGAVFS